MAKILIVDDEPAILTLLEYQIRKLGHEITTAKSGEDGWELFCSEKPDAVLLDINLPGIDGLEVLERIRGRDPSVPVLMMTAAYLGGRGVADGMNSVQMAVKALAMGAHDYLLKPSDEFIDKVRMSLTAALRKREQQPAVDDLRERLTTAEARFATMIGESPEMHRVFAMTEKVIDTDATVLVLGESGTGKELLAQAIHYNSRRSKHELVVLNCAAITESLLESELFGHEKGSFTGAAGRKVGKFEAADGGTIFLDEIGDMPLTTQAKVLRVLQEGEVVRVGGNERVKVDVRCIAATHRDLETMVESGDFREDLYYRLNVYPIRIPPLRERPVDIPLLAAHFIRRHAESTRRKITGFADDALQALCEHAWSGNVRELENALLRAVILAEGETIQVQDLPAQVTGKKASTTTLAEAQARAIRAALAATPGDLDAAAERLGVAVDVLQARAAEVGIELG